MGVEEYERLRQQMIGEAVATYRDMPSRQAAITLHETLMEFYQTDRAAVFRRGLQESFRDEPGMLALLADRALVFGLTDEAEALYRQALDGDPQWPAAQLGLAQILIDRGELDDARARLRFLEQPGTGQVYPVEVLFPLAEAYQKAHRHEEALELLERLGRERAGVTEQKEFRKRVRKSEKALTKLGILERELDLTELAEDAAQPKPASEPLTSPLDVDKPLPRMPEPPTEDGVDGQDSTFDPDFGISSAPPPLPGSRAPEGGSSNLVKLVLGFGVVALLMIAAWGHNEWVRRNRTLHVVNDLGRPLQIQIDDQAPVTIEGLGTLTLAEGTHRLRTTGAWEDERTIDLETRFFERWSQQPVWVFNPGSLALLRESEITYSQNPEPIFWTYRYGEPFLAFEHVDYAFEPAPDELRVGDTNKSVTKVELVWDRDPDRHTEIFYAELNQADGVERAFRYAETRLDLRPDLIALLEAYWQLGFSADPGRVEAFLQRGLDERPVRVEWHLNYQSVSEVAGLDERMDDREEVVRGILQRHAELTRRYDQALANEPDNADLLFLRGARSLDQETALSYYQRAQQRDPRSPWPIRAQAQLAAAQGRWPEALDQFEQASRLGLHPIWMDGRFAEARMAAGQVGRVLSEAGRALDGDSPEIEDLYLLADAMAITGQTNSIVPEITRRISGMMGAGLPSETREFIRVVAQYQAGDLEGCLNSFEPRPEARIERLQIHAQAMLVLGRVAEARQNDAMSAAWDDPLQVLAASLAWSLAGELERAQEDLDLTLAMLPRYGVFGVELAELLGQEEPPTVEHVQWTTRQFANATQRALVLAILAERFPERRDAYHEAAEAYMIRRLAPYHLVRRALGEPEDEPGTPESNAEG